MRHHGLLLVTATIGLVAGGAAVATTSAGAAAAGCRVSYTISSQWQGGFGADVAITNLGDPINGWTLTWSFATGQRVTQAWNATVTQSGTSASAVERRLQRRAGHRHRHVLRLQRRLERLEPGARHLPAQQRVCTGSRRPDRERLTHEIGVAVARHLRHPGNPGTPGTKTVRVFWLRPTNVAFDQRYPDGIAGVMREAQRYYRQELGRTFALNANVVETVNGEHDTNWYINTNCDPGGDRYWCVVPTCRRSCGAGSASRNPTAAG